MAIPDTRIVHDKRVLRVRAHSVAAAFEKCIQPPEVEGVTPLTMGFVVFEPDEWQSADIDLALRSIGLRHGKNGIESIAFNGIEPEPAFIALTRHITREGGGAGGPPE